MSHAVDRACAAASRPEKIGRDEWIWRFGTRLRYVMLNAGGRRPAGE